MAIIPEKDQQNSNLNAINVVQALTRKININDLIEENKTLESELHLTLEEIAHLQNALANAKMKLIAYENSSNEVIIYEKKDLTTLADTLQELYIPLNTISNYCDLLLSQSVGILGTLQKKFVERIDDSTNQIHELLDVFQNKSISTNGINQQPKNFVDIHVILEKILSQNTMMLREKQLVLQMEVPDEIPMIVGDVDDLYSIIDSIVMNAFLITPKDGSICITALLDGNQYSKKVNLRVRDGGPGIPAHELKKIFPLQRYNNPSEIPGCAIKRPQLSQLVKLTQKQDCVIKISNAPGFGSVFEVSFSTLTN